MKNKILLPILAFVVFVHCQKEQPEPTQDPPPLPPVVIQDTTPPPPPVIPVPILLEPSNGTTDYFLNVTYRWTEILGADLYQIQVSDQDNFVSLKDEGLVNSAQFVSLKLLSGNNAYYWRARARVGGEWRGWSDTARFEVGWRHNVPDFRKRYEGTYVLRDTVYGYQCMVYNPPSQSPWCAEYGYFGYSAGYDTLVVKFDDNTNSLRVGGPNLKDTTGYIYLHYQDGTIHSDGKFSGYFSWTCTSRSINGYFRNDSLVYTFSTGAGGCEPIYTTHHYKGKRQ